ncbi:hypothetical protein AAMO2058_000923700 [Amorphochlora amoebiformis]
MDSAVLRRILATRIILRARRGFQGFRRLCHSVSEKSKSSGGPISWYLRQLDTRPIITKSITAMFINSGGDVICQVFVEGSSEIDKVRVGKMSFLGLCYVGPILHFWFGTVFRWLPQPGLKGVVYRIACDQTLFAIPFVTSFFALVPLLDGRTDTIIPTIKRELWPAIQTNWVLWIPAQFINFSFVPLKLQVLFANGVAVIWNVYLSMASHRDHESLSDSTVVSI